MSSSVISGSRASRSDTGLTRYLAADIAQTETLEGPDDDLSSVPSASDASRQLSSLADHRRLPVAGS